MFDTTNRQDAKVAKKGLNRQDAKTPRLFLIKNILRLGVLAVHNNFLGDLGVLAVHNIIPVSVTDRLRHHAVARHWRSGRGH